MNDRTAMRTKKTTFFDLPQYPSSMISESTRARSISRLKSPAPRQLHGLMSTLRVSPFSASCHFEAWEGTGAHRRRAWRVRKQRPLPTVLRATTRPRKETETFEVPPCARVLETIDDTLSCNCCHSLSAAPCSFSLHVQAAGRRVPRKCFSAPAGLVTEGTCGRCGPKRGPAVRQGSAPAVSAAPRARAACRFAAVPEQGKKSETRRSRRTSSTGLGRTAMASTIAGATATRAVISSLAHAGSRAVG